MPSHQFIHGGWIKKIDRQSCGKVNPRNAPTLFNAAAQISAHWIGNRADVEDQAKQSVIGPPSFGLPSYEALEIKLKEIKGYNDLFKKAFPKEDHPITVESFAKAVGAFVRTLVTPSPFDAFLKGDKGALKEKETSGLKIFMEAGAQLAILVSIWVARCIKSLEWLSPFGNILKAKR